MILADVEVMLRLVLILLLLSQPVIAILDFEFEFGGVPNNNSSEVCSFNTQRLNDVLRRNVSRYDSLRIVAENQTMYFRPGIIVRGLENVRLVVDGAMAFQHIAKNQSDSLFANTPPPCLLLTKCKNITIEASESPILSTNNTIRGLIDGQGSQYWAVPFVGYLQHRSRRPKLLHLHNSSHVYVQQLILKNCPIDCLYLDQIDHFLLQNASIVSRRTDHHTHEFVDLTAFGTKGITITESRFVTINEVDIWTQDECISVRDKSSSIIINGVNASGMGISLSSTYGPVRDVTLLNSRLFRSTKGLSLTFDNDKEGNKAGETVIEHITVVNLTMEATKLWPLFFGPAQRASEGDACQANPCSLCWPQKQNAVCNVVPRSALRNITLRHVQINNPSLASGVLLSDSGVAVFDQILFDNVRVTNGPQLSYANKDLTLTFPGLKLPVSDEYLPYAGEFPNVVEGVVEYYVLPSKNFLGLPRNARVGIIVGTILFGVSLVLLLIVCLRLQDEEQEGVPFRSDAELTEGVDDVINHDITQNGVIDESAGLLGVDETQVGSSTFGEIKMSQPLLFDEAPPIGSRRVSMSCHVAPYHVIVLLAAVYGVFVGFSYLIELPGKPDWEKTNRYYKCEGVTNGIAIGNTWPVPICFVNKTEWFSWAQFYDHVSSVLHSHFVLAACVLTCCSLYIHFSFLFKERTPRNSLASFGNED
jgi:hypothetical protein